MGSESVPIQSHVACPNCGSSDARTIYSDGHSYCFSCNHQTKSLTEETSATTYAPRGSFTYSGEQIALPSRKISFETCRKFNVRGASGPVIRFPYTSVSGQVVGYKEKDTEKNFRWVGKNAEKRLFGQQLFGGSKKTLVISEGELDALAIYEARPKWPVCSIFSGAAGAYQDLQANIKFCMEADEIILLFDQDQPGQDAAIKCASLFPPDRCKIGHLAGYKDACEALMANDAEAIRQAIWNAAPYKPKTIIDGRDLLEDLRRPTIGRDADWFIDDLNTTTGGLRRGELVLVTGPTGGGKSTFLGEQAQSLINQGKIVGYIPLEESTRRTGLRLMSVEANKPLHIDNTLDEDAFNEAFEKSVGSGRLFLRDGFGSVDVDSILSDMRYLVKAKNVEWIILDHISIMMSGNASFDERKSLDEAMTKLRCFVEENQIGLILVSHLRRTSGDQGHEDNAEIAISLSHLRGSQSLSQLSDIVVCLQRAVSKGSPEATLHTIKNRFLGSTGYSGSLSYNPSTGRMVSTSKSKPRGVFETEDF